MADELEPSDWTVSRARRIARSMIDVAEDDLTYAGVEHFEALCEYLDDLYGGQGFTRLLEPGLRPRVAELITRLRGSHDRPEPLRQPVNSALTLDQGRRFAADRLRAEKFVGELARALHGLYGYADELYGGPDAFTELLEAGEREQVAALVVALQPRPVEYGWMRGSADGIGKPT